LTDFVLHSKYFILYKTSRLLLFRKVIVVYLRIVRKTVCGNNAEFLNVELSGI